MAKFMTAARTFIKGEEGATMVEYGLMLALIAVICIVSVGLIGTNANNTFASVAASVGAAS